MVYHHAICYSLEACSGVFDKQYLVSIGRMFVNWKITPFEHVRTCQLEHGIFRCHSPCGKFDSKRKNEKGVLGKPWTKRRLVRNFKSSVLPEIMNIQNLTSWVKISPTILHSQVEEKTCSECFWRLQDTIEPFKKKPQTTFN